MLSAKHFFISALAITLAMVASVVGANVLIDNYSLFGNARGKRISLYYNERLEKNILSRRYVPENFNALLIGPSTSFNVNTGQFRPLEIYNLSILGGTITEIKALVDNYLELRSPRLVIICMYPYMLRQHGMKTDYLSSRAVYGALGSIDILKRYVIQAYHSLSEKELYNEFGYHVYEEVPLEKTLELIREKAEDPDYARRELSIDPLAWQDYLDLIQELRERNVKIIQYYHPVPRPIYERHREFFDNYLDLVTAVLPEDAITVDFNIPKYKHFTTQLDNFQDDCHLSGKGAAGMEKLLHEMLIEHVSAADVKEEEEEEP
ncbi:MAG: hypothetical protein CVU65_18655 [Deltaproteobacteria bacterium HGW-Deltaproteobacteria-22]|jgi:hypothetical protein|nr:MAG: hypothetical protein CVU65_18655 [Deltaproteobacteria bacterium HGW-Deltaproteobacteria-22]